MQQQSQVVPTTLIPSQNHARPRPRQPVWTLIMRLPSFLPWQRRHSQGRLQGHVHLLRQGGQHIPEDLSAVSVLYACDFSDGPGVELSVPWVDQGGKAAQNAISVWTSIDRDGALALSVSSVLHEFCALA